jgi:hypothetical protein
MTESKGWGGSKEKKEKLHKPAKPTEKMKIPGHRVTTLLLPT